MPHNGSGPKKRARKKKEAAPKPGFAAALALVVQRGRQVEKEIGKTALSKCPRCGHVGPTEQDFGTRVMTGGKRRPQSWCRDCRKVNLPPLKALPKPAGRREKGLHAVPTQDKPGKARVSGSRTEGWLFPPEVLGGKSDDS